MNVKLAACGILGVLAAARADTVSLQASRDNTLYQDLLGQTSNGQGTGFFVGVTNGDNHRRGLLRFDLSTIPAGSTVTGVVLQLHLSHSISFDNPAELRRALQDWGEGTSIAPEPGGRGTAATQGDATWLHTFYSGQFWSAPGGAPGVDFSNTVSATTIVGAGQAFYTWGSTPELIADTQAWLDNPASNFGWFILGDESALGTAKRFDTREAVDPTLRPVLTVTYTPPCYANCDASTTPPVLTANDFQCFLNAFAAQAPGANCDESTTAPVLTANDFQCFLNKFAAGCV